MVNSIRVLIADDHPVVRAGIRQVLAEESDIDVVGEAESGNEVLDFIQREDCDVILLDISMPGKGGVETLKRIRDIKPKQIVLILSMYPEDQYAVRLLKSGAAGYLTKESAPDKLVSAVRKVASGKKYISSSLAEILADNVTGDAERPLHETLSNREFQIFCMLAAGKMVSEVATDLSISVKTVSTYRSRILEKMGMSKNAELTYYAIKNNLIE